MFLELLRLTREHARASWSDGRLPLKGSRLFPGRAAISFRTGPRGLFRTMPRGAMKVLGCSMCLGGALCSASGAASR
jgi:hypothetical protein